MLFASHFLLNCAIMFKFRQFVEKNTRSQLYLDDCSGLLDLDFFPPDELHGLSLSSVAAEDEV